MITEEYLIFNSYKVTLIQESFKVRRTDILKVEKKKTMFIIPNKVKVHIKNNKEYTITTWEQEKIYSLLTKDYKDKASK